MVTEPPPEDAGNADIFLFHLWATRSEMLVALLRRMISSTSKEGPEIILESGTRRNVRKRIPPVSVSQLLDLTSLKYGDAIGPPMVRSRPLRVPPRYPEELVWL